MKACRAVTDRQQAGARSTEDRLFFIGLAAPFVAAGVWLLYYRVLAKLWPFQGCLWDRLFGVYCPGCGGTRAMEALLSGHLLKSFWYHPLILYGAGIYGIFMASQSLSRLSGGRIHAVRFHNWYLYGALAVIAVNLLVKNVLRFTLGITL